VTGATLGKYDDPSTDSCKVGYNDDRSIYVATFDKDGACLSIKTFGGSRDFFLRGGLDASNDGQISLTGRAFSSFYYGNNLQYRVTSSDIDFTMILGQCVAPKILGLGATAALCEGESVTLKPQFFGLVQNLAWLKNGVKVNADYYDENYTIDSLSDSSAGDYWLRLTGACGSDSMKLTVNQPKPKPNLLLDANETYCEGFNPTAVLRFTGTPPFNYSVEVDGANQDFITNKLADTLTFNSAVKLKTVSVSDNYCTAQLGTDSIQFKMQKLPISEFTVKITDFLVKLRSQATFYDKLSWSFGDGNGVKDDLYPAHTYAKNGTYTITLIAENQCGTDTFTQDVVIDAVGVGEPKIEHLDLYPNPATENITIDFGQKEAFSYRIFTTLGQLALVGNSEIGKKAINISELEPGSYYIMVYTAGELKGMGYLVVE
ncbi:MAG: T9SS type A sorting domain-containing protein, partial [Bacteroidetes bacterium]|nr:T9SS type A sorting domain-containing protein [Bacteroidota bacterium]